MGRQYKYSTLKEAAEAKKQADKKNGKKFAEKVKNNPELQKKLKVQKKLSRANRIATMTAEEIEQLREYNRIKQQEARAKKKADKIPSQKDLVSRMKAFQLQVACEQIEI